MADESKRRPRLQGDFVDRCRKGKPESELRQRPGRRTGSQKVKRVPKTPNQNGSINQGQEIENKNKKSNR